LDFLASKASGSTLERWVLLLSLMPLKSPLARFLPGFGAPKPSDLRKQWIRAHFVLLVIPIDRSRHHL
jgi:hypothetical protein